MTVASDIDEGAMETLRNFKKPHKKQGEELREKLHDPIRALSIKLTASMSVTGKVPEKLYEYEYELENEIMSLIHFYATQRVIDELKKLRDKPLCYADHDMDSEIDFIDGQAHARDHIVERLTELEKNNE